MLVAALLHLAPTTARWFGGIVALAMMAYCTYPHWRLAGPPEGPLVVGIQLEHPSERLVLEWLDKAIAARPNADLLMLSEYTFSNEPPESVREWCRGHQKHLLVGGVRHDDPRGFRNTTFVIGPDGRILHTQGKSVPIQFFTDGLPADRQELWMSPWGPIGIAICYDLGYTRVIDRLVEQGAGAILVPTMDLTSWGQRQHELHARLGPARAGEYGVSVVRVCSSGVSQIIDANGIWTATAGYPGQGEMVAGQITIQPGRRPPDRWLAPTCTAVTGGLVVLLFVLAVRQRFAVATPASP
jgi:apolipoprotein N-acyltransferase